MFVKRSSSRDSHSFTAWASTRAASEDITQAAGVPKGSFYNHFKSKELLALEAMERYREAGMHPSLVEKTGFCLPSGSKCTLLFWPRTLPTRRIPGDVCMATSPTNWRTIFHRSGSGSVPSSRNGRGVLASVVREGQTAGDITTTQKPEKVAGALLSAWEGTLIRAKCTKDIHAAQPSSATSCCQLS